MIGAILIEFKRVLRPGRRLVMINMTKGQHCCNGGWDRLYRFKPAWIRACRGVLLLPHVQEAGFSQPHKDTLTS